MALARGAKEAGAAGLHDAFDGAGASGAGVASLAIDLKAFLEIAQRAVGGGVIAQTGATGGDGFVEDIDNSGGKAGDLFALDAAAGAGGVDAGAEERFADVDVAEAGDETLIEEERLGGGGAARKGGGEHGGVEIGAERFGADSGEERVGFGISGRDEIDRAEAAGVVEGDAAGAG